MQLEREESRKAQNKISPFRERDNRETADLGRTDYRKDRKR